MCPDVKVREHDVCGVLTSENGVLTSAYGVLTSEYGVLTSEYGVLTSEYGVKSRHSKRTHSYPGNHEMMYPADVVFLFIDVRSKCRAP